MDQFDEKDSKEFSIIGLFAVTGICCLLFSLILKALDGSFNPLFNKIGFVSLGLFALCFLIKWALPTDNKHNKSNSAYEEN